MSYGPSPHGVQLPSLPGRIALALVRVIPLLVLLVGVPAAIIGYLAAAGIHSNVSLFTVGVGGILFTVFSTVRYLLRPTRAFGPAGVLRAGAGFGYLWYLIPSAFLQIPAGSHATLTLGYGTVLEALLVVPVLMLITAGLVTVQDHRNFAERLRLDFPSRP
ncbi:MAG: hypothetical protein ACREDE_10960 [Thermoplasmata archaeon]